MAPAEILALLTRLSPYAKANAKRCRAETVELLYRHTRAIVPDLSDTEARTRANETYRAYQEKVSTKLHVSINLGLERLLSLAATGELMPTTPPNQWDRLPRDNVEKLFIPGAEVERPIYGAVNATFPYGAAPSYCPDFWLALKPESHQARTSLTSRNTYHVVNPGLGDFNPASAVEALRREVFLWDGLPDCFLAKYGHPEGQKVDDYIEAQIWGGIRLEDVQTFHVEHASFGKLKTRLAEPEAHFREEILKMATTFNKP